MNRDRDERGRFKPGNRVGGRFTPNKQPKTAGRKPTLYKQVARKAKEVGEEMGRKEFYDIMLYLVTRTVSELKELANNPNVPVWVVGVISALFGDIQSGNLRTLNSILDRCYGRPSNIVSETVIVNETTNNISNHISINLSVLNQNEIIILNNILNRETELIDEALTDPSKYPSQGEIDKLIESEITKIEEAQNARKQSKEQQTGTS